MRGLSAGKSQEETGIAPSLSPHCFREVCGCVLLQEHESAFVFPDSHTEQEQQKRCTVAAEKITGDDLLTIQDRNNCRALTIHSGRVATGLEFLSGGNRDVELQLDTRWRRDTTHELIPQLFVMKEPRHKHESRADRQNPTDRLS
ncbi:hypothetical protein Q8A73_009335 [Channa argus]|nr:hypothetical protein Q8A73_009335 [Channa argus]